jgi:hypothetical protein
MLLNGAAQIEETAKQWLQPPANADSSLADFSTLKMEATRSSKTSVHTRSKWRHIPEGGILHSHCRENLKSYKESSLLHVVQTDSGTHPASYPMGTGGSFPGGKAAGA